MYHHLPGGLPQHHLPFLGFGPPKSSKAMMIFIYPHRVPRKKKRKKKHLTWSGSARDSAYVSVPPPSQVHRPAWVFIGQ